MSDRVNWKAAAYATGILAIAAAFMFLVAAAIRGSTLAGIALASFVFGALWTAIYTMIKKGMPE